MASVTKDSRGWRIRYYDPNGTQRTMRPGKGTNKATAEQIGRHVDHLVVHITSKGVLNRPTAIWLGEIGDSLYVKLQKAGLVEPRTPIEAEDSCSPALVEFIDRFIADGRTKDGNVASASTKAKWRTARNHLLTYFDQSRRLDSITAMDAQNFRKHLEGRRIKVSELSPNGQPLSENAKRKLIATTKVMFNAAIRLDLIERNPFEFEVSSSRPNRARDFFVTAEMTLKLIEAAPDTQWKLMIALWRLAGLRKMEIFGLNWDDILWDKGRFRVKSPKTAHLEGLDSRLVPIGPVLPYLEAAFDEADDGTQRVVTRYAANNFNLHKPFLQIIQNASLNPWPKLFQNLRSSCETEWLDSGMPAHVVANWIGHSVKVQNDNYAQVDDHHFDVFNKATSEFVALPVALQSRETTGMEPKAKRKDPEKTLGFLGSSADFVTLRKSLDAPERSRTSTSITDT